MKKDNMIPCPYCGEMIKENAKSCRYCGSDEKTGWSDETYLDGIDLGDDIDYDEITAKEFPKSGNSLKWWESWKVLTAAGVLLFFLVMLLHSLF